MNQSVRIQVFFLFLSCVIHQCDATCLRQWFGSKCQYLCHCVKNYSCDDRCEYCNTLGQCPSRCAKGWFGSSCQYQDLSVIPGVKVTSLPKPWLTDGDDTTCNNDQNLQSVNIAWDISYPFTWLRIVVNNTFLAESSPVSLNFKDSNGQTMTCKNMLVSIMDERTIDYRCNISETVRELTVTGSGVKLVCSLYISGGRNVAIKQETIQSSIHGPKDYSYQAADGNTSTNYHDGCYHTTFFDTFPSWTLILETVKSSQRFVVYNRGDCCSERLKKFKLQLFDESEKILWTYSLDDSLVYTRILSQKANVKKIYISPITTKVHDLLLNLCEVELFGECVNGFWGLDCSQTCPDKCRTWCHQDTGECPTCLGYSDPPQCQTVCPFGTYGVDCKNNCSQQCLDNCDLIDGSCSNCKSGYQGKYCDQACQEGTFGNNCQNNCSTQCWTTCNQIDGSCSSCISGYQGIYCDEVCQPGTYGEDCKNNCSQQCFDNCDYIDGSCSNCKSGFQGKYCDQVCRFGTYGEDCKDNCSQQCLDNCDHINGSCFPCKAGYHGNRCDQKAVLDTDASITSHTFGIGFGSVAVALLVLAVLVFLYIRRRTFRKRTQSEPEVPLVLQTSDVLDSTCTD